MENLVWRTQAPGQEGYLTEAEIASFKGKTEFIQIIRSLLMKLTPLGSNCLDPRCTLSFVHSSRCRD